MIPAAPVARGEPRRIHPPMAAVKPCQSSTANSSVSGTPPAISGTPPTRVAKSLRSRARASATTRPKDSASETCTKAVEASKMAVSSPLLEDVTIDGATGVLLNITGGLDMTMAEVNEACTCIKEEAHPDANIIFGTVIDERMKDEFKITVIATGFDKATSARREQFSLSDDLRTPAFARRNPQKANSGIRTGTAASEERLEQIKKDHQNYVGATIEDNYDIPTYLRRDIDSGN